MKKFNFTDDQLKDYKDNYSEPKFWNKMKRFAKSIGRMPAYCILVLYYVLQSPNISISNKTMILGALGYFILPLDLIPDLITILGFTDDIAALTLAYKAVQASVTPEIKAKANAKLTDWFD